MHDVFSFLFFSSHSFYSSFFSVPLLFIAVTQILGSRTYQALFLPPSPPPAYRKKIEATSGKKKKKARQGEARQGNERQSKAR